MRCGHTRPAYGSGVFGSARFLGTAILGLGLAQVLPAATWLPPVRRVLAPGLCGPGATDHLALTFDDGPDPRSTPYYLDALDDLGVRATFFCVGERARRNPRLVREAAARGHEVAVHGWRHRNQLLHPGPVHAQIRDARDLLAELSGSVPTWYRPPYGVLAGQGVLAATRLGLRPVLWSQWAKDWTANLTAEQVFRTVRPGLVGGATILLHDTDAYAQPDCWRATLGALPSIILFCRESGLRVGPLSEHARCAACPS